MAGGDWMMHHPVDEATPELKHLRSDAAWSCPSIGWK
jgi:hypothetical protein